MNRRHFLSALTAAVAGATIDPERALWIPGKKMISIPKQPISGIDYAIGGDMTTYAIYAGGAFAGMKFVEMISVKECLARYGFAPGISNVNNPIDWISSPTPIAS